MAKSKIIYPKLEEIKDEVLKYFPREDFYWRGYFDTFIRDTETPTENDISSMFTRELSDDEKFEYIFYRAIKNYAQKLEEPNFTGTIEKKYWFAIKNRINGDIVKWFLEIKRNTENGAKGACYGHLGGRPQKNNKTPKGDNKTPKGDNKTPDIDIDSDSDIENINRTICIDRKNNSYNNSYLKSNFHQNKKEENQNLKDPPTETSKTVIAFMNKAKANGIIYEG